MEKIMRRIVNKGDQMCENDIRLLRKMLYIIDKAVKVVGSRLSDRYVIQPVNLGRCWNHENLESEELEIEDEADIENHQVKYDSESGNEEVGDDEEGNDNDIDESENEYGNDDDDDDDDDDDNDDDDYGDDDEDNDKKV